jgi:PiT family inorganic phosphate transporter
VILVGLIGAIVWNLLTWFLGLPSSSSHALFGGLVEATWVAAGADAVHFGTVQRPDFLRCSASWLASRWSATAST